ncbi:hypothetical protein [Paenibacillus sp. NRS-1760]|uniref:hypothetical protein n=1 Tax=Paenibacillus sp. NRS-1760 TaxID=3233902 RepID=UPI003D2E819F
MRKKVLLPLLILLIIATAVLFIIKSLQADPLKKSISIEQKPSANSSDTLIVKDENGENLKLKINYIPPYKQYLQSQEDSKTEIERTHSEALTLSTQEHFILLKYSCGNKQCSTILVKESNSTITSLALGDGIFQDYQLSPGKTELLLRYGYSEGGEIVRHTLIAVDLLSMEKIPFESTALSNEYMSTPIWPILDYQWIEKDRFMIESADLASSDYEAVKHWYTSTEKKTKFVEISINKAKN